MQSLNGRVIPAHTPLCRINNPVWSDAMLVKTLPGEYREEFVNDTETAMLAQEVLQRHNFMCRSVLLAINGKETLYLFVRKPIIGDIKRIRSNIPGKCWDTYTWDGEQWSI